LLDLAFGRRSALSFDARRDTVQTIILFNSAHQDFLPFVVLTVADDLATELDAVRQDVDVFMRGISVSDNQKLVVVKTHPVQITLTDFPPLLIRELLS
jgi:hypothetical protein